MFTKKIVIQSSNVDAYKRLRLSSLLIMTQDISTEDIESQNGLGKFCREKGYLWVISRTHIKINRLPNYLEEITLKTYPNKARSFIFPRHYIVEDKDGNELIKMISLWFLIDKKDRKPRIFNDSFPSFKEETQEGELPLPKRIEPKEVKVLTSRKVLSTDIDINGHMNNTRYLDFVYDLFSNKELNEFNFKEVTINYSKEVHEGQIIDLCGNIEQKEMYIEGQVAGEKAFEIKIEY